MPRNRSFDADRWALDLYAAVLDGQPLTTALSEVSDALGASQAIAHRMQVARPGIAGYSRLGSHNIDPEALHAYASGWVAHDPWVRGAHGLPPGTYDMRTLADEAQVLRSPFWNEFVTRHGATLHGMTMIIAQKGEVSGAFTLWRGRRMGAFETSTLAHFRALEPHVRRAFLAESMLATGGAATAALDALHVGVAVLEHGRLVHANAALRRFADQADGLRLAPAGLIGATSDDQGALEGLVGRTLAAARGAGLRRGAAGHLFLRRPSGRTPWRVEALPMAAGHGEGFGRGPAVVLLVTDGSASESAAEAVLRDRFGLTPAEASLAASLTAGVALAEHARRRRIAMPTARTHLSRILEKTGCRRQADLVAALAHALR